MSQKEVLGTKIEGAYKLPSFDEMNRRFGVIEDLWNEFLALEGLNNLTYYIHKQNLFEVIKRQDQRMHYFRIFHGLDYPCEYKYIAVECFWINTLKPFIVIDENCKIYDCPNEKFSLFLILAVIRTVYEVHNHDAKSFDYPSSKRLHDILYDFKYCTMSREAMIAFIETLAENYGVGIDFILDYKKKIQEALKKSKIWELWQNKDQDEVLS